MMLILNFFLILVLPEWIKAKVGNILLLPPDYTGNVPDGYWVFKSPTYRVFSFVRANAAVIGFGESAMDYFREGCKIYPLSTGPRECTYTNVTGVPYQYIGARRCYGICLDA